jgi:hypothetical protein
MTNHDGHDQTQPQDKPLFMPGFLFHTPINAPARKEEVSEPSIQTERQRHQTIVAAVQQRRSAARSAQRNLAAHRSLTDDQFRTELARIQQLCHQNRQDDTCPRECVVRQWRRGVPLGELNGMKAFRRRLNGGR